MPLGADRVKEIFVEGFLDSSDENEVRDFAYIHDYPGSEAVEKAIEGTKYDLECDDCGGDIIYSDKEREWFCPFCEGDNEE